MFLSLHLLMLEFFFLSQREEDRRQRLADKKARKAESRAQVAEEERTRSEASERATAKTTAMQQRVMPAQAAAVSKAPAVAACSTCGCTDFKANPFKPGKCNSCFHAH
jgi:Flp pilus assembly protein TadB